MLLSEVQQIVNSSKKGTIHTVAWSKTLGNGDAKKDFRNRIQKQVIGYFRVGVTYSNMEKVKIMRGDPTQDVASVLPWGHWLENYTNTIIEHKDKYYLRLTAAFNSNLKIKTKWFLDGEEVTKEQLIEMDALGASQRKENNDIICFSVDINNITDFK